ncbi:MAG TPA: site-specific DNA-methyltransferase [Gemmatimonadales bacterium]
MLMLAQASAHALPLGDESVQMCVTSPPYWGLRAYQGEQRFAWGGGAWYGALGLEPTPELYVEHIVEVFREVRRVLRPDGTLWLNLGSSYAGGGNGGGGSFATERPGWSVFGGRDPSRYTATLGRKQLVPIPWLVGLALQQDGWILRCDVIWSKPNPMPESVRDRPTKAHEYVLLLSKAERYFYDADAIREPHATPVERRGNKHGAMALRGQEAIRPRGNLEHTDDPAARYYANGGRNARSVWEIATQPYPGAHFATYPERLAERCILAGSAAGDIVLDPFNGSGTTGRVALRHGRRYVGLDISREYLVEQSRTRIDRIQHEMGLGL